MMPHKRSPEEAAGEPVNRGGAPIAEERIPSAVQERQAGYRWYHKIWAVILVTFCIEIGCFLVLFPWTRYWDGNYFAGLAPAVQRYWNNDYVRGAVSGLGALNLYIAIVELFRLSRKARRQ
jgi:hypothetical protein